MFLGCLGFLGFLVCLGFLGSLGLLGFLGFLGCLKCRGFLGILGFPGFLGFLETVKQNALNSGYAPDDIDVGWMDADECYKKQTEQDFEAMEYTNKRKLEYPTIEELIVACYDTDDKADIEKRRADVKAKYPKPE